jgi:hypothetical protein
MPKWTRDQNILNCPSRIFICILLCEYSRGCFTDKMVVTIARKFVPMSVFVGDAVVENETEAVLMPVFVVVRSPWIPVGVAHWRPWWRRCWCYGCCFISVVVINWKPVGIPFPLAAEFRVFARRPVGFYRVVVFCCWIFTRIRNGGNRSTEVKFKKNVVLTAYRGWVERSRQSSCPLVAFQ